MTTTHLLRALSASAFWLVLLAANSQAATLASLFQGSAIIADDKIFNNFTLINLQGVNGGVANTALIDVTPLVDDPLNPGIRFTAPVGALGTPSGHTGAASIDLTFSFDVSTDNGAPLIKDNSLLINGFSFNSGPIANIQVSEQVFDAAVVQLGTKLAFATNQTQPGDGSLFDSITFTPRSFVHVIKQIDILGFGDNDVAFLTMFEQRFSQIPESNSLALLGVSAAIVGLTGGWRRRSGSLGWF